MLESTAHEWEQTAMMNVVVAPAPAPAQGLALGQGLGQAHERTC